MAENPKAPPKKAAAPSAPAAKAPLTQKINPPMSDNLALTPAAQYMTRNPAYVTASATVRLAMQMMLTHKVSGLPVLDNQGGVIGVYSEVDAMLQASHQNIDAKIKYTQPAKTVGLKTSLREVLVFMVKNRLKRVPVVDGKKLAGIISRRDIMKVFFEDHEKEKK